MIVINKNKNTKNTNKRMLSASPETPCFHYRPQDEKKTQASKKNKTQAPIQRSSSLSEGVLKPGMLNFRTKKY